jgi:hypothetical protein
MNRYLLAGVLCSVTAASAQVIDFGALEVPGTGAATMLSYSEDGFTINNASGFSDGLASWNQSNANYAGSAGIFINHPGNTAIMTPDAGGTFSVFCVDISTVFASGGTVTVTFTANGGSVVHQIQHSGFGFTTYALPATFQNITDFGWDQVSQYNQIDNIKLVPAPGALTLLGLGGLAAIRRRR